MTPNTRSDFLKSFGLSAAALVPGLPALARGDREHAYLAAPRSDAGEEHIWHGYPDECYSFTAFADSLVALAWGHGWYMQPPMVDLRNAIAVDFASSTEEEAVEASLAGRWNGASEFPMGAINTVSSRVETNAQNARIERHLALIGTAMRQSEFSETVIQQLFDPRTHPGCEKCAEKPIRTLGDVLAILADGTDQAAIHLFAQWEPSQRSCAILWKKKEHRHQQSPA